MKFTRLNSYSTYIKFEGTDVWVDSRNLHDPYYHNLNDYRHQSYLEEMEKKRSRSQDEVSKKRKQEEDDPLPLILSELTKIKDRQDWLGGRMKKFEERLKALEGRFADHVSLDSSGAITAANTISSLGTLEDDDCCCPFDCIQHRKKQ